MRIGQSFGALIVCLVSCAALPAQQYTISTFAGGNPGFADGAAASALFSNPLAVAWGGGKLYVADTSNQRVRVVSGGQVSTFAGNGTAGYSGDAAAATSAEIDNPVGVAVDAQGNVYISDTSNSVVRKVSPAGTITTFAGSVDSQGAYSGDGGPANVAGLNQPEGLALDSSGNLYIADTGNNVIRKVTVSTGIITTAIGYGATAGKLNHPEAVAVDSAGHIYVCDTNNRTIWVISGGGLKTVAGIGSIGFSGDGGPATLAQLNDPAGLAVDAAGNLYISDTNNDRIRMVNISTGIINTIAGNGAIGYSGDGGPALSAQFFYPHGLALDNLGNIYIADTDNAAIRVLSAVVPTISSGGIGNAASFQPQVSPGALASIFGTNYPNVSASASAPFPTTFQNVQVTVNGLAAPVFFVSSGQINFQVPWETAVGNATVTVSVSGIPSNSATVPVLAAAPGLFLNPSVSGAALVQNADYSVNTPSNPAARGNAIIAYLSGSGPVSPAQTDGAAASLTTLTNATSPCTAALGSAAGLTPLFCGLAPGWVGLVQVNLTVPTSLSAGTYPLTVTIDGQTSNAGNITIK
jgi:uncharacterized protein (TIGR03437 family)